MGIQQIIGFPSYSNLVQVPQQQPRTYAQDGLHLGPDGVERLARVIKEGRQHVDMFARL